MKKGEGGILLVKENRSHTQTHNYVQRGGGISEGDMCECACVGPWRRWIRILIMARTCLYMLCSASSLSLSHAHTHTLSLSLSFSPSYPFNELHCADLLVAAMTEVPGQHESPSRESASHFHADLKVVLVQQYECR